MRTVDSTLQDSIQAPDSTQRREPHRFAIVQRIVSFFRAHPVLSLLLLTPGIPEYLSGSSPIDAIVLNPLLFVIQLIANLGLYGPGVLLIREATIRWKKGWGSVFLLAAAYGILEEGVALSTLFNPNAGPVDELGVFGHWAGVNWVWLSGILTVHILFSISLPILLLGLALPETKGKSFLESRKKIFSTIAILGLDVFLLSLVVFQGEHFWMGWTLLFSCFVAIGALVFLAHHVRPDILQARSELPKRSPALMGFIGVIFYPAILFTEFGGIAARLPALFVVGLVFGLQVLFLFYILSSIGNTSNDKQKISLSFGLIIPIAAFGLISQISLPIVLLADSTITIFFLRLLKQYGDNVERRVAGRMDATPPTAAGTVK